MTRSWWQPDGWRRNTNIYLPLFYSDVCELAIRELPALSTSLKRKVARGKRRKISFYFIKKYLGTLFIYLIVIAFTTKQAYQERLLTSLAASASQFSGALSA